MAQSSEGCGVPALEQRRCLLLAVLGSTAESMPNNLSLISLMNAGLLVTIKSWLSDILEGNVGGVDLLLHLLSMITSLPVTKDMVTSSRLGKAVSAVEKDKIKGLRTSAGLAIFLDRIVCLCVYSSPSKKSVSKQRVVPAITII